MADKRFTLGFLMGLIVGEGTFSGAVSDSSATLSVKLHARDPKPLEALQAVLGGKIYGPYRSGGRVSITWHLRGRALRAALPLLEKHLPDSHKRQQFEQWILARRLRPGTGIQEEMFRQIAPASRPRLVEQPKLAGL